MCGLEFLNPLIDEKSSEFPETLSITEKKSDVQSKSDEVGLTVRLLSRTKKILSIVFLFFLRFVLSFNYVESIV